MLINFTYEIPDVYGTTSTTKGLTQTSVYNGPEKFYIQVTPENKIDEKSGIRLEKDAVTLESWLQEGNKSVLVDAKKQTLLAYLLAHDDEDDDEEDQEENKITINEETEQHYYLPNESTPFFSHIIPIGVDEIYEIRDIIYNQKDGTFYIPMSDHSNPDEDPFPKVEDIVQEAKDFKSQNSLTQEQISLIDNYILEVKKIPSKYRDWPRHMWPDIDFPIEDLDTE